MDVKLKDLQRIAVKGEDGESDYTPSSDRDESVVESRKTGKRTKEGVVESRKTGKRTKEGIVESRKTGNRTKEGVVESRKKQKGANVGLDATRGLTQEEAEVERVKIYKELLAKTKDARREELQNKSITIGDKKMKWLEKQFGDAPFGERSLLISMHGGGACSASTNDEQWLNQFILYEPKEGIYVAPRAPTNTWNLWHEEHIDRLFHRLIENMVALGGVDPDKVYLMGYSAGGDGVWQLAPRMADRFAAASMMAGHPNDAEMLGLRNLPFGIFCGEEDTGYNRNEVCEARMEEIREMAEADPGGYVNMTRLYEDRGHWMKGKEKESLPWMAGFTRRTWPKKVVWYQDHVTHSRFYWLERGDGGAGNGKRIDAGISGSAGNGTRIDAEISGQEIALNGNVPSGLRLLLHDALLDLDQPVKVKINDGEPVTYQPNRSAEVVREALGNRLDPKQTPTAKIVLE